MDELIDKLLKAPPLYRWGGLAVALVLLTLGNFLFLVNPVEGNIGQQQARQRALDAQLQEKSEISQNLNERRREMDVLQQKLDEALSELPEQADVDELDSSSGGLSLTILCESTLSILLDLVGDFEAAE